MARGDTTDDPTETNLTQWVNIQLKAPPIYSFAAWTKNNDTAEADLSLRKIYDESKQLFVDLCGLIELQDEARFISWVERVNRLEPRYRAAMKEHGLGELPPAEVIIRACLCRDAILQITCSTCQGYRGGSPKLCCASQPPAVSNAAPKCNVCRRRGVHCNWGKVIPLYMSPIKVAIQGAQWARKYHPETSNIEVPGRRGIGEDTVTGTGDGDSDVAAVDGRLCLEESLRRFTLGATEEPVAQAGDRTLTAQQLEMIKQTELALGTSLAAREENKKAMISAMVQSLDRIHSQ